MHPGLLRHSADSWQVCEANAEHVRVDLPGCEWACCAAGSLMTPSPQGCGAMRTPTPTTEMRPQRGGCMR